MSLVGLDFGASRGIWVRVSKRGTDVSLDAAAIADWPEGDPAEELPRATALRGALDAARAGRGEARLGIAGKEAILRYLHLPIVPPWRLRLLMEHEIRDVEEKAQEPLSSDYRLLTIPDPIAGPQAESEIAVLVALAKETPLGERIAALKAAGVGVAAVVPAAIALFNAYVGLGHVADSKTVLLVDLGESEVQLAIVRDGFLVFARSIPRPPGATAEPDERESQQLAGAIASSLQIARTQQKLRALPVDEVLLSGANARSEEARTSLRRGLKIEPGTFNPLDRLTQERLSPSAKQAVAERGPELAIAVGLALSSAHPRTLDPDLLPRPEKARREFATRTVFLYAGGALLAIALLFAGVKSFSARSAVLSRQAELKKMHAGLEARREGLEAQRAANKRTIQTIDALSKRTQPGGALIRLLERLREATPPRVTVSEVALDDAPPPPPVRGGASASTSGAAGAAAGAAAPRPEGEAPPTEVLFKIRGEVDNASGDAAQLLGSFEAGLRDDPAVIAAKVTGTPVGRGDATQEFTMSVRMRGAPAGEP